MHTPNRLDVITAALVALALLTACESSSASGAADAGATDATATTGDAVAGDVRARSEGIDFKIMVDRTALAPDFSGATTFRARGTFSDWASLPLVDDGTSGDLEAGDGVYTVRLSDYTDSPQDLLHLGDEEEFVVEVDDRDYVDDHGDALEGGVSAWSTWVLRDIPGWEREVIDRMPDDEGKERSAVTIGPK